MYYNDYNRFTEEQLSPLPVPQPQEQPKKKKGWLKITALCLACALLGGVAGGGDVQQDQAHHGGQDHARHAAQAHTHVDADQGQNGT